MAGMSKRLHGWLAAAVWIMPLVSSAHESAAHYISAAQVELVPLLAPPPSAGSARQRQELAELLRIQRERSAAEVARALADDSFSVYRFADVLGSGFTEAHTPLTAALFQRIIDDMGDIVDAPKQYWHRERPTSASRTLRRLTARDPQESKSYPSGHASFSYVVAVVLSQLLPEKAAALFRRADEFAHNRVVVADHYTSDVEAGRIAGTVIAHALLRNPRFNAELRDAGVELRRALDESR